MSRVALKFADLDAFLDVMEEQGFGQQAHALIYENDQLPYRSIFLLPTELLPITVDLTQSTKFGGTLTRVNDVNFLGTEVFYAHFMIYPYSRTGYVEVDDNSTLTFADDKSDEEQAWKNMIYVINLEDGGNQEFYLTVGGGMVGLATTAEEPAQEFKTYKLAAKKMDQIRGNYPATCQVYALERGEFEARRKKLQH
jgi:hypothetical protein